MIKLVLFCHLLVSLKCTTQEEYDAAMTDIIQQYENFGWNNKQSSSLHLLYKLKVKKVLRYEVHKSQPKVVDEEQWESIALVFRVSLKMGSPTNALESIHRHLNKKTQKLNNFFLSIQRVDEAIMNSQTKSSIPSIYSNTAIYNGRSWKLILKLLNLLKKLLKKILTISARHI